MAKMKAQSLSEYMLPIALVSILGIVSLSVLGGNLNTMFTGLIGTKPPSPPATVSNRANFLTYTPSPNYKNPFPTLPGKNITVDLGNGKSLSLRMADPVAAAESAGGSGVTENALAAIEQITAQLKAQGEDPSKIAALEQLALKGQRIKDLQNRNYRTQEKIQTKIINTLN
ncbi:MAG: hypothetical protein K2X66_04645, partial [Cyanobacteria bacterium]|nr:hypothetical protein [Cyanobacteriota bacterium]